MEKPGFWRRRGIETFDLRITEKEGRCHGEALHPQGGCDAASDFPRPFSWDDLPGAFGEGDRRDLNAACRPASPPAAEDIGSRLFSAVFDGDMLVEWRRRLDQTRQAGKDLRLRLRLNSAELWDWPWELLHDPQLRFLAMLPRTPVVRYVEMPVPVLPLKVRPPLRILAVASSPEGFAPLDVERELADLEAALEELGSFGHMELERLARPTADALLQKLRNEPFHVLHFIGHGTFDAERGGMIALENEDGSPDFLDGDRLSVLLAAQPLLRLVVLNACQAARGNRSDRWGGLMQGLIRSGLPAVIAMRTAISDRAATVFSKGFYESLGRGEPVDRALAYARQAMVALEAGEWTTPLLAMQSPDGQLFDLKRWQILWVGINRWAGPFRVLIPAAILLSFILVVARALSKPQFDPNLIAAHSNPPECPSPPSVAMAFAKVDDGKRSFCIGRFEVTQRQWGKIKMGTIRSRRRAKALPATVSWTEANQFLAKLNAREPGATYRLPTAEEWERAGQANLKTLAAATAATANCENKEANDGYENTAPVGSFSQNGWGLYDMAGNVAEWVSDRQGDKALRYGGSYENALLNCTPRYSAPADPDRRLADTGFRIVREVRVAR
ncbi:MAG: CHAT domain-containing protein [Thermoanaerobaculia bacterium]